MLYNKTDVLDFIRQEDVKFIRLSFCDVFGAPKNISIPALELENAFEYGKSIDGSAIRGFTDEARSDLFLFPDPSTMAVLPWRPAHGRVARMFCQVTRPEDGPLESDSRYILKKAVKTARDAGLMCYFGAEYEFYLFKTDESGSPTSVPIDMAGYMDMAPEDAGENVRREICLTLEEMGILPESSHHEEGPGQNEVDFRYGDPLSSADNCLTFKTVVKAIAAKNGLSACFDPKPLPNYSGNGLHINMSPVSLGGDDCFMAFMAGILAHISEITLFLNPTDRSYMRLGSHKSPQYITWSPENRSQLIRIPAATGSGKRIELRSPDAMANPYLAYALLIHAGLDGVKRKLHPGEPCGLNLYAATAGELSGLMKLPASLIEAKAAARSSDFVRSILPEPLLDAYLEL